MKPGPRGATGSPVDAPAASDAFAEVQRPILQPLIGRRVEHWLLAFPDAHSGLQLMRLLTEDRSAGLAFGPRPAAAGERPAAELSLGLTAEGLRRLVVPRAYLSVLGRLAPAFMEGARVRAAARTGDTGPSAPAHWKPGFEQRRCHAILSLHTSDATWAPTLLRQVLATGVERIAVLEGQWLGRPDDQAGGVVRAGVPATSETALPADVAAERERWVHFGYRDGLSQVPVRGFPLPRRGATEPLHEPGEFVLGHENDVGANPGLLPTAPRRIRAWLRDGSFGVLRLIAQDVRAFEDYVDAVAREVLIADDPAPGRVTEAKRAYVKAKLCGRWPDGRHFELPAGDRPRGEPDDPAISGPFDHAADPQGVGCPFASHIRRMNPRPGRAPVDGGTAPAHARPRTLLRRGTPYGAWGDAERGLLGWFFCARLEDQFEYLLGEWADRMPLGLPGGHASKDPLIGQHESARRAVGPDAATSLPRGAVPLSARFAVPVPASDGTAVVRSFPAPPLLSVTRGMAYAFYPSRTALQRIAAVDYDLQDDPEQDEP